MRGLAATLLWVLAAGATGSASDATQRARSPAVNTQPSFEQGDCSYTPLFESSDGKTSKSPEEALHAQLLEHPGTRRVLEDEYWDRFLFEQTGGITRLPDAVQDVWPEGGVTRAAFEVSAAPCRIRALAANVTVQLHSDTDSSSAAARVLWPHDSTY